MAHNSRVATMRNTDDSAYNYDGAYYSYTGDDYLGNNHGTYEDSTPDHYYSRHSSQRSWGNSALPGHGYATEQGLTRARASKHPRWDATHTRPRDIREWGARRGDEG